MEKTINENDFSLGIPQGALDAAQEGNPELREWFKAHPEDKDAHALPMDKKKEFILMYYSEDVNADELLEKMLEEAEKMVDKEIAEGRGKPPFSEALVLSIMTVAKAKVMDELVEDVAKIYEERRKLIKGKEITDPGVIKVTQMNLSKMAFTLQSKLLKQVEEEAKSHNFAIDEFMNICVMVAMSDLQSFVEIERVYNLRKGDQAKEKDLDLAKVKQYIEESLAISEKIAKGEIDSSLIFVFPHLLSDKLYNQTGLESEEVVQYIRRITKEGKIEEDLVDLIIREAYSVEKSKDSAQKNFDTAMVDAAKNYEEQAALAQKGDPLEDPSVKKMIEMGLINKDEVEELVKMGAIPGMGGMPPGMMGMPPGMMGMPPGMMGMPPGMMGGMPGMPPGMPQLTPEMMMQMMASMPPGMFPPEMMDPSMFGEAPTKKK